MLTEIEKARQFKNRLKSGTVCLGAQIGLSDPSVVEICGRVGYDWLVIDTEHAANSLLTVQGMLQAGAGTEALVIARTLRLDEDEIRRLLDIGSPGIVCPFINSGDDARRFVSACKYPPTGIRGFGPRRAGGFGTETAEYFRTANDAILLVPIIESKQAAERIEEIVSTEGIDAVLVGPADLSISLGCPFDYSHQSFTDANDRIREACTQSGVPMGTGCYSLEHAARCQAAGDQLLLIGGDDGFLANEARRVLEAVRRG